MASHIYVLYTCAFLLSLIAGHVGICVATTVDIVGVYRIAEATGIVYTVYGISTFILHPISGE